MFQNLTFANMFKVKDFYRRNQINHFIKLCYCDKPKNLQKTIIPKEKDTKRIRETPNIITENYEECTKFEEKVLKQVLMEKEKDASLQSRLSKECRTLFSTPANKLGSKKCDSIHLDLIALQKGSDFSEWGSYSFDHLQQKSDEQYLSENTKNPKIETMGIEKADKGGGGGGLGSYTGPRPVRQEPGKVLFCLIPEEWWRIFIPKTGVTGFGTFLFTFITFLVSKEIYVLEHNYYGGVSLFITIAAAIKYIGPFAQKTIDKSLDQFEKSWNEGRVNEKQSLEDHIDHELLLQFQAEGQLILIDAKRENVHLQLEEEFRKRQMIVYTTVKQLLDYQLAIQLVKQRIQQKNLVQYVTREVQKAITPEMQDKLINYSIDRIVDDLDKGKK